MEDGDFRRRPPLWTSYFSPEEVCFLTTVHTLASGSSGNALLLSCGESYILLDAGISCRRITAALRELGLELGSLTAILITHTHADHISDAAQALRRPGFYHRAGRPGAVLAAARRRDTAGRAGLRHPPVYRRVCRDGISHIP